MGLEAHSANTFTRAHPATHWVCMSMKGAGRGAAHPYLMVIAKIDGLHMVSACMPTCAIRSNKRVMGHLQVELEKVGGSYAIALVNAAQGANALEAIHADMDSLSSLLKENDGITSLLANPVVDDEKKRSALKSIAQEIGFNPMTTNFLNLLIDANRFDAIDEIVAQFETKYCALTDTQVRHVHCWRDI